jgi:outer membrane protein assembly factor BamB
MYFTAQAGSDALLLCYGTDGKEKWRRAIGSGALAKMMRDEGGNYASASCSTDGKRVYAFVGSGALGAYDPSTGSPVWELNVQDKYGKFDIQFGGHWTPVLYKDRLYLAVIHRKGRYLIALDAATGNELWKANRTSDSPPGVESPDVYASPFVWEGAEGPLLVVHGDDYCTGHKIEDGSEVWRVTGLNPKERYNRAWRDVSSPLVTPDLIVVPSCKKGVTVGVDPHKAKGNIAPGNPAELWRLPKNTPDVSSPLLVDGVVYLMRETGELEAVEANTGKLIYSEKVTNERHRANPVYADEKIILVGRDGTMGVVKPGREFELLAKNKLPDTFTASPVVSAGRIYLRGWNNLWAIGTK